MENKKLIDDLISALCGDEYEEASEITKRINESGDEVAISLAEEINSVL